MTAEILVVDDDEKISTMLKRSLLSEGYAVETAADGLIALQRAMAKSFDLVILDLMLPGMDGFAVCKQLRQTKVTPILMLTARDAITDRVTGLDLGADDYLVKPFALDELFARVRVLLRRTSLSAPAMEGSGQSLPTNLETKHIFEFGDIRLDVNERLVYRGEHLIEFTVKEFDLLQFLLEHPHLVLSRERLLSEVWGYDYLGKSNIIDVYIGYLRQKLELEGLPRVIQTVRGVGYVLREN